MADGTAAGTLGTTTATGITIIIMQDGTVDGIHTGATTTTIITTTRESARKTDGTAQGAQQDLTASSPEGQASEAASAGPAPQAETRPWQKGPHPQQEDRARAEG